MRIRHHLTQAARSLRKSPAYVAAFVITLGLAIGVNSAVFSLVNGVLLQPLPFQDAERILYLKQPVTAAGVENTTFSFMEIDDFRAASSAIDEFVEFGDWGSRSPGRVSHVVGVVADAQEHRIGREGVHTVYRPASQGSWGPAIVVASDGDPSPLALEVRDVIHGIEPDRAVDQVRTLADLRAEDVSPSRLNAMLFGSFAVLALAIAAVGVLGTLGFSVSQRMREFGIRMALGADRSRVLGSVLGEGLLLLAVALVAGVAGAVALGRVLSGLLFAVDPVDPASLVGAAVLLTAAALLAALLPALRAVRVHPSTALRSE